MPSREADSMLIVIPVICLTNSRQDLQMAK